MSEDWLIERGIGETRAARIEHGHIVELRIERDGGGLRAGMVRLARLTTILAPLRRGIVRIGTDEALLEPLPRGLAEGGSLFVEIVRDAIPESGRAKLPKATLPESGCAAERDPVPLTGRELAAHQPDELEAAGWSEALEEARSGLVPFDGGTLAIALTPAMTLIDVDGTLPPAHLALAAVGAAARTIVRHGIAGNIGIDLLTVGGREVRIGLAAAFDDVMPQPFERTIVNGFGFLQVVRRRTRASIFELVQSAPVETAALALLRQAERATGPGTRELTAASAVTAWLDARHPLMEELRRRSGAGVRLRADPALAISAGHVHLAQD